MFESPMRSLSPQELGSMIADAVSKRLDQKYEATVYRMEFAEDGVASISDEVRVVLVLRQPMDFSLGESEGK